MNKPERQKNYAWKNRSKKLREEGKRNGGLCEEQACGRADMLATFGTANVMTLGAAEARENFQHGAGMLVTGKQARLDHEFNLEGLHVVGVQETRIQGNCHCDRSNYKISGSSANAAGQGGVQMWLALKEKPRVLK
jgi:hypothetical protein